MFGAQHHQGTKGRQQWCKLRFFISQVLLELITLEVFDLRTKPENIKKGF